MYGRITRLEGSPDQIDAGMEFMRTTILPAARELEGFRGVLSLSDRASGKGLTITFWETEEAMQASEERASQMRDEAASAFGGVVSGVERYEVTISEITAPATV